MSYICCKICSSNQDDSKVWLDCCYLR